MLRKCWGLFLLVLLASVAWAQTPDTATLRGRVLDPDGRAIPNAEVTVANTLTGSVRHMRTTSAGTFQFGGLPISGAYTIHATASGFAAGTVPTLHLVGGVAAQVDIRLAIPGGVTRITVTGQLGSLRTDEPQMGDVLSARQIQMTPLLNRRITYLPLLNAANRPAINEGDIFMNQDLFNTNGAGRRQTWFEVDGANANDSWGRQTIFSNVPVAAVEEMTILENSFSAEYGASAGSVVNIVTKSGTNHFHGMALGLWRPSATEAELSGFNNTTATSGSDITNDTLAQGAASLSGPLLPGGHTQFFLSGEYSAQDRASPVTSPVAPGNFIGRYRGGLAFLRIDHEFNPRHRIFLREDDDMFYDTNPKGIIGGDTLPSVARTFRRRTYTTEIGDTYVISPALLNDLRAQMQLASPITEFDPVIYGTQFIVPISNGGTFMSGTSQQALLLNHQYSINDVVSADMGRHQFRFGASLIAAHTGGDGEEFGGPIYDGQFQYKTCTQALSYCESSAYLNNIDNVQTYTQSYGNAVYTVNDFLWALFLQDDFEVSNRLTLNLGLRYEQQTFTDSRNDFGPRLGFDYDFSGHGRTVLRGGFGVYYSQVVDNSEANYALTGPTGVFNYTAAPGQVGFPASVSAAPLPSFPAGAQVPLRNLYIRPGRAGYYNHFFPTSTLKGYPSGLRSPYTSQWILGLQQQVYHHWVLSLDYVGSRTRHNVRPLDLDSPAPFIRTAQGEFRTAQQANCTRPYWIVWYQQHNMTCNPTTPTDPQPPYSVILTDVNDGYANYDALDVNLSHPFANGSSMLASYSWSHTLDNVDPDVPSQNPNDPNFTNRAEYGNAGFDQRNRFVLSGVYAAPFRISLGGIATLASGLPFNYVTGTVNSGDPGATTDRPVIHGHIVGRNTGLGGAIYDISPFIQRDFAIHGTRAQLNLRAEAFNATNHANFVGYSGTYGNGPTPGPGFGQPLTGISNQLPAREFQFSTQLTF
jgi:hypothetical protein